MAQAKGTEQQLQHQQTSTTYCNKSLFEWSLKPLLVLLRCFGVPLYFEEYRPAASPSCAANADAAITSSACSNKERLWRKVNTAISFLLFPLSAVYLCALLATDEGLVAEDDDDEERNSFVHSSLTSTVSWNRYIELACSVFVVVAGHALLLVFAHCQWRHFVRLFSVMEHQLEYTREDYQRFRLISYTALTAVLMEILHWIAVIFINRSFDNESNNSNWTRQLSVTVLYLSGVRVYSFAYFFGALGWMLCAMFSALERKLTNWNNIGTEEEWRRHLLPSLKTCYYSIDELLHQTSNSFGPFLLLVVSTWFLRMINLSFTSISYAKRLQQGLAPASLVYFLFYLLVKDFVQFCAIVYVPQRIRNAAMQLNNRVTFINFQDIAMQNQVGFFKLEMSSSLPRISAAGLYDINCQLIPTFVGTTLTYLIILNQFDSAERSTSDTNISATSQ